MNKIILMLIMSLLMVNIVNAVILYDAGSNLIILDDSVGAGDSWGTAYDMEDVLTNVGAVVTKQGVNAYDVSARMQFNSGVYFVSENEFVEVKPNPINPAWTWRALAGSHVRIGYYDATDKFCCKGSFWKIYVSSTTASGGNYWRGESLIYGSTIWNDADEYTDSISFEPSGTTKVYDSVMSGKAYMRTPDIDFRNVRWINNNDASFSLMVASGFDYAWSGITTIKGTSNGGIFMSGTTTSDVDLYDVTFQDCDKDVFFSGGCNWLLRLINSPTFSTVSGIGSGKPGMKLCYTFNVLVTDNNNNPLSGALVVLKDNTGSIVFSLNTQGNGKLATEQIVNQKSYRNAVDGGTVDYNNHTLKITLNGYADYETDITINHKIEDDQVCLDALTYSYDDIMEAIQNTNPLSITSTVSPFYSPEEEVNIYSVTTSRNGSLVNSTININVTYPDGIQSFIGTSIYESNGRYEYNFTLPQDAPIGIYHVKIDSAHNNYEIHDTLSFYVNTKLNILFKKGAIIIRKLIGE